MIEAVLAEWPADSRPDVEVFTFAQVFQDDAGLDEAGLTWVVADAPDAEGLSGILTILQDRQLPTLLTRAGDLHEQAHTVREGVVSGPPTGSPTSLCVSLRTLWSQSPVLGNLRREVRFLRAHQGGLCEQMDKIDEELRLAAQLQREFLPQSLPKLDTLEFHVLFRPAGYVSGDIYDVIRLDEEHVGVFIADAVGHGVPAALMTMYIKRALPAKTIDPAAPRGYRITPPDEAIAQLNRDMLDHAAGRVRFATACYAVINCRTFEVTLARAGHPFPLIVHADGTAEHVEPEGAMLGLFADEVFQLGRFTLGPGDRLLLYSDGFELAFPRPEELREGKACLANQQYCDEFKSLSAADLGGALSDLARTLDEQAGSLNQQDDMTVVCVGVPALAPHTHAHAPAATSTV